LVLAAGVWGEGGKLELREGSGQGEGSEGREGREDEGWEV
jgi:hypothetical protein